MDFAHPADPYFTFDYALCTRHFLGSCERPRIPHPTLTS